MKQASFKVWRLILALSLFWCLPAGVGRAERAQQANQPNEKAKALLAQLTPEERVAQLFLISFRGRQVDRGSQIYDLIVTHSIGGVVLSAANDNFTGPTNTVEEAHQMISALQNHTWEGSQGMLSDPLARPSDRREYIPLFIAVSQEGDGAPNDQILSGMTPLPNEMAIGATWDTRLAERVGQVMGGELHDLGVNMLMGPSLDVLETSQLESGEDLGTRTFGGDPYWVGEMGKAYIRGVHSGSENQVAVIAKHFPGRGGSDRPPGEEVATVRKSLEQLKQIELAPFFAVTGGSSDQVTTTDGLLASHIRYQGFQGNIRATTRPVSFDANAFEQLMSLPQFTEWRNSGGIVVSDDLGSPAVRRFFDPTGVSFDGRQVARSAFQAGNDLLYVNNFLSSGDPDAYTSIIRTLDFFAQKYREDPAFAQKVDQSVEKLLTLKFRLYPQFSIDKIVSPASALEGLNHGQQVSFDVAQRSITLLSPDLAELPISLPQPPQSRDRIVFITDVRSYRQCSQCIEEFSLPVDALQKAVVRLYGPRAGEQVLQYKLLSYSFTDLYGMLTGAPNLPPIEEDIRSANWVVFAMADRQKDRIETQALRRFLSERADLLNNKKIVVFAFNAPYYLDATDISKLSAYYASYSKSSAFIDVAARVLFQELAPSGAMPVSVPGVGYDLITATSPNPSQVIQLYLDLPEEKTPQTTATANVTPEPTKAPSFTIGDTLPLRTGIIYDSNRNPVPDGTVVRFLFSKGGEVSAAQQIETVTTGGIARASYRIQSEGMLEIRVISDPAMLSEILRLDVSTTAGAMITAIAPTLASTSTPEPTETPTPTSTAVVTAEPPKPKAPGTGSWLFTILLVWSGAVLIYFASQPWVSTRWGVRWGLMSAIGGLAAFFFLSLGWPFGYARQAESGWIGLLGMIIIGMVLGLAGGVLWKWRSAPVTSASRRSGRQL